MECINKIFYQSQYRDLSQMPVFVYEKELDFSQKDKLEMITKIVTFLKKRKIKVSFSDYILDEEITKSWETESVYRPVPIAELMGNEIVVNPRNIDFLSVLLSIGHIYGHLVQRSTPERYKGITDFLHKFKPLGISELFVEYKAKFDCEYKDVCPSDYVGDYKKDFLRYEIEAFAYARYAFIQAGIDITEQLQKAIQVYLRTDYEELWRWASKENKKDAQSFMVLFQKNWNEKSGWEPYQLGEIKKIDYHFVPDKKGRLTVVRDGYEFKNIYLT